MKRYSLLVCAVLCSSPVLGDSNQLTGSLNDLSRALQKLQQKLAPKPQWEQDAQKLADRMTLIWQTIQTCQYSANDIKDYKNLLAQYRQLIKANNAESSYRTDLDAYAILPFEAEMNCLIAQFDQIMQAQSALNPQLINAYEKVYNEFIKEIPASQVDPNYKGWLDAVQDYVKRLAAGTGAPPPPPMPSPISTQKPFISPEEMAKGTEKLKPAKVPTEPKPTETQGGMLDIFKKIIGIPAPTGPKVEPEKEEGEWGLEEESPEEEFKKTQRQEINKRTKREYALTQDSNKKNQINQQRKDAGLPELTLGYQTGEEQQLLDNFDKETRKKFLQPSSSVQTRINTERKEAGLPELPGAYRSGEKEQLREELDKETKRQILDAGDKTTMQEKEGLLKIAAGNRRTFGLSTAKNDKEAVREAEQYLNQFENFKQQKKLQMTVGAAVQAVHDKTVRDLFIAKDVYKNNPTKLQEVLKDINQERSDNGLPPLSL